MRMRDELQSINLEILDSDGFKSSNYKTSDFPRISKVNKVLLAYLLTQLGVGARFQIQSNLKERLKKLNLEEGREEKIEEEFIVVCSKMNTNRYGNLESGVLLSSR